MPERSLVGTQIAPLEILPDLKVVTADEMRAIEARAVEAGATWQGLMETAGAEVARQVIRWRGQTSTERVMVLAGPGNNGGDALVVARHLSDHGWTVDCWSWSRSVEDHDLQEPLVQRGVEVRLLQPGGKNLEFTRSLEACTIVVDGLLGTGIKRDVAGGLAETVRLVAQANRPVVAIDIPTGVDSDTGAVRGVALRADMTVALGCLKYGHVLHPGKTLAGEIRLGDIGLTDKTQNKDAGELLTEASVRALLPARPGDANKGTFGKVMVVAGSVNFIGAAALATQGAMRIGAGLVTLACPGDLLPMMAAKLTECTFLPLPSDMGSIASHAAEKVRSGLDGYSVLLVGCGIGKEKETAQFLRGILARVDASSRPSARAIGFAARVANEEEKSEENKTLPPIVLDGDALNILSEWDEWSTAIPEGAVLTPHPGEMARLTGSTVEEVQADRARFALQAAERWKCIVVLKGAATVIAEPGGTVRISPFSNAALSTAGTGDVLAGAIAGLIAQGLSGADAASVGVYLHGLAGEMLSDEYGASGGLAGDLPVLMAKAQKRVRDSRADKKGK